MEIDHKLVNEQTESVDRKVVEKVAINTKVENSLEHEQSKTFVCQGNPEKAKVKRIKKKLEKLKLLGLSDEEIKKKMVEKKRYPVTKTVEDFIDQHNKPDGAHWLEVNFFKKIMSNKNLE